MVDLTPEQIARIEYLATDAWVIDNDSPDSESRSWRNFEQALGEMGAVELHHFASNFNWDCGVNELVAVIDHPACDAGTALMIYWLGQPGSQYRLVSKRMGTEDTNDVIRLLRRIEHEMATHEFRTAMIDCDPTNIMGQPMTRGSDRDREVIPAHMFEAIKGIEIVPHRS